MNINSKILGSHFGYQISFISLILLIFYQPNVGISGDSNLLLELNVKDNGARSYGPYPKRSMIDNGTRIVCNSRYLTKDEITVRYDEMERLYTKDGKPPNYWRPGKLYRYFFYSVVGNETNKLEDISFFGSFFHEYGPHFEYEAKVYDAVLIGTNKLLFITGGPGFVKCNGYITPSPYPYVSHPITRNNTFYHYNALAKTNVIIDAYFELKNRTNALAYLVEASGKTNVVTWDEQNGWVGPQKKR